MWDVYIDMSDLRRMTSRPTNGAHRPLRVGLRCLLAPALLLVFSLPALARPAPGAEAQWRAAAPEIVLISVVSQEIVREWTEYKGDNPGTDCNSWIETPPKPESCINIEGLPPLCLKQAKRRPAGCSHHRQYAVKARVDTVTRSDSGLRDGQAITIGWAESETTGRQPLCPSGSPLPPIAGAQTWAYLIKSYDAEASYRPTAARVSFFGFGVNVDATLLEDRTIIMTYTVPHRSGNDGHSVDKFPPDHPQHSDVMDRIGPLEPGTTKPVRRIRRPDGADRS